MPGLLGAAPVRRAAPARVFWQAACPGFHTTKPQKRGEKRPALPTSTRARRSRPADIARESRPCAALPPSSQLARVLACESSTPQSARSLSRRAPGFRSQPIRAPPGRPAPRNAAAPAAAAGSDRHIRRLRAQARGPVAPAARPRPEAPPAGGHRQPRPSPRRPCRRQRGRAEQAQPAAAGAAAPGLPAVLPGGEQAGHHAQQGQEPRHGAQLLGGPAQRPRSVLRSGREEVAHEHAHRQHPAQQPQADWRRGAGERRRGWRPDALR